MTGRSRWPLGKRNHLADFRPNPVLVQQLIERRHACRPEMAVWTLSVWPWSVVAPLARIAALAISIRNAMGSPLSQWFGIRVNRMIGDSRLAIGDCRVLSFIKRSHSDICNHESGICNQLFISASLRYINRLSCIGPNTMFIELPVKLRYGVGDVVIQFRDQIRNTFPCALDLP